MRLLLSSEDAFSLMIGYIIFSSIFFCFFMVVHLSADEMLIAEPSEVVVEDEFRDIGNMISTMITDIYLIAPENGEIETEYMVPSTVGGEAYTINADSSTRDQIIEVASIVSDKSVSVTMSGITETIPINGTAMSSTPEHRINYDSRS